MLRDQFESKKNEFKLKFMEVLIKIYLQQLKGPTEWVFERVYSFLIDNSPATHPNVFLKKKKN
jgi:hypothetical protein